MTRGEAQPFIFSDVLLRAIAEVRSVAAAARLRLSAPGRDDLDGLLATAAALEGGLTRREAADRHELRNQLGALRGYAEMLLEQPESGEQPGLGEGLLRLLQATHSADDLTIEQHPEPTAAAIATEPGFILAVDDRLENRELVARHLSRCGHFVVTAAGGAQALATLGESDVDVVLLDLAMPGMDGREVLARIKAHPDWHATPVIVISGHQDMQGIIDCIEAGADDYLFKPFNPVLLEARIKAGIERKRWHDREAQYRHQLERNERFIRATFGRYLSDEIVSDILERPEGLELGGDLREVTILMSDIRGFTTLCEQLQPDQVVGMLNRYLGAMTDIILAHDGTIDEFLGDAILAVFGAPRQGEADADRAVQCALAMQDAMAAVNAANGAAGLPALRTAVALNTGVVIAGNIGSERRCKYGFVGHPMNVTSRIEDATGPGEVLAADSTLRALAGRATVAESRQLRARGIDEALPVHRITAYEP